MFFSIWSIIGIRAFSLASDSSRQRISRNRCGTCRSYCGPASRQICVACHGAQGEGGLGNAIAGSAIATGALNLHLDVITYGVAGSAMQAFGGQLNDVDLAAVTTYQRNAFGNNMGDMVQPVDVYNFKKGQ